MFNNDALNFVTKVLSDCYFFNKDDVSSRFNDISYCFHCTINCHLPARLSASLTYYNSAGSGLIKGKKGQRLLYETNNTTDRTPIKIPVSIDKDGNQDVRNLIKAITGYWVSNGEKNSHFKNYKISHIWGEAFDPRYFTNLWNIVLVPAWANDLLDKPSNGNPLIETFQQVMKKVCILHYKMSELNWSKIDMKQPEYKAGTSIDYTESFNDKVFKIKYFDKKGSGSFSNIGIAEIKIDNDIIL